VEMRWTSYKNRSVSSDDCVSAREWLSRFLDSDLRGEEATRLAAHLHGCLSCRAEMDALRAHRAIRTALPAPPGGRAARERVLRRFKNAVHAAPPRPRSALARTWVVSAGFALSLAGVIAAMTWHPAGRVSRTPAPAPPAALSAVALPERDDLDRFFELHDQSSRAAQRRDIVRPASRTAAVLSSSAATVARAVPAGSLDTATLDDIPEAL
jgi:hypothetical protein